MIQGLNMTDGPLEHLSQVGYGLLCSFYKCLRQMVYFNKVCLIKSCLSVFDFNRVRFWINSAADIEGKAFLICSL